MREFSNFPWDDGSCRILRCPPSHQEMALMPHYAHASARAPQPSHLPTPSTVLTGDKSPLTTKGGARCSQRPQRHIPLATSCPLQAWGGNVPKRGRTTAWVGGWHPRPTPLGHQCHLVPLATSCPLRTWGGMYVSRIERSLVWVNGTLARYHRGGNGITKLGQYFFASSVSSLSIHHKGRGVLPDGSDCYAISKGDSIQSPDGHCQMGCSRKCGRCLRVPT
jgi:hypothetical protein